MACKINSACSKAFCDGSSGGTGRSPYILADAISQHTTDRADLFQGCRRTHHTHKPRWACASSSAVSPPSYTEMVPDEAEITIAVASVTVVMASAAA